MFAAGKWKTTCHVLLSSLFLSCSHFFLPHFSPSASSVKLWVSSTLSLSRACSAALLAVRQTHRRPRAVLMCGPLSTQIHQAFFHHVMCLFDTSFSRTESVSFFSSTHSSCVVISSFPSWPSRTLLLAHEPSFLLAPPALSSAPLAPPALFCAPFPPLALSFVLLALPAPSSPSSSFASC